MAAAMTSVESREIIHPRIRHGQATEQDEREPKRTNQEPRFFGYRFFGRQTEVSNNADDRGNANREDHTKGNDVRTSR